MGKLYLAKVQRQVRDELERCVEFWLRHGMDADHGGIYTCLDRRGEVYSTDKSVWMQGRAAWTFSHLCNLYGPRPEWLAAAKSCLDFLQAHCINLSAGGRLFFDVTADGKPLRQRRYFFSEGFYCIACAEYYAATGEAPYLEDARNYYEMVYRLNHGQLADPTGLGAKTNPATRQGRALGPPMIYLNTSAVLRRCDAENAPLYSRRAAEATETILTYHHKPELRATLENVGLNGEYRSEISSGRLLNPGHAIECAWFIMDEALHQKDEALFGKGVEILDFAVERGWDQEYGGLLYFTDLQGRPCEACEHDMKLWWPHNELAIASLTAYTHWHEERHLQLFRRCFDYMMEHFADPECGEWYGYLRRDGVPTQPASKGTTYKGPFHLPRMLVRLDQMLNGLLND